MIKNYFLLFIALLTCASLIHAQENVISFEADEGYELGDINEQQGWTTTGVGSDAFTELQVVTDERSKTGGRSLKITNEPNIQNQPFPILGAFYILDNPLDISNFSIGYSMSVDSAPGYSSSTFALACGSIADEKLVLELYFVYDGRIIILENNLGGTDLTETNIGNWERDTWYDLRITGDGDEVHYYLNDELVHTGELLYNIDELRFVNDNYSGSAYIDDINIVYETLNVQDLTINPWTIYPNPVKDILNLEGLDNVESYAIFDITGRKLEQFNNFTKQIDVRHLSNGMYLLQINTDKGQVSKKFIKN